MSHDDHDQGPTGIGAAGTATSDTPPGQPSLPAALARTIDLAPLERLGGARGTNGAADPRAAAGRSPAQPAEETDDVGFPSADDAVPTGPASRSSGTLFALAFYGIVFTFVLSFSSTFRGFLLSHKLPFAISAIMLLGVAAKAWMTPAVQAKSARRQAGLVIFLAMPVLLGLAITIFMVPPPYKIVTLRSVFLLIVCILPATLYYLFIASRKSSLLQEYYTNLARLGLFERQIRDHQRTESEVERRVRVMSYIKKFEALYGPISVELAAEILEATDQANRDPRVPDFDAHSRRGLGDIFTADTTVPIALATLLIGLGWLLTLPPWEVVTLVENAPMAEVLRRVLAPTEMPVQFAFLGAYFFSLQMLFRRYVRKDLRANAYLVVALRIILAVIGTWTALQGAEYLFAKVGAATGTLQSAFGGDTSEAGAMAPAPAPAIGADALAAAALPPAGIDRRLLIVAFVIGAFPPIAWKVIHSLFLVVTMSRFLVKSLNSGMPASELHGLTVWHEARLEEEDIENVPNMATADMVDLMLYTRIPPSRIVDWVDQALLYTHLGPADGESKEDAPVHPSRQRLGAHGIRTASSLITAFKKSQLRGELERFEAILPVAGCMRSLVDALSTSPNLTLVLQWRRLGEFRAMFRNEVHAAAQEPRAGR